MLGNCELHLEAQQQWPRGPIYLRCHVERQAQSVSHLKFRRCWSKSIQFHHHHCCVTQRRKNRPGNTEEPAKRASPQTVEAEDCTKQYVAADTGIKSHHSSASQHRSSCVILYTDVMCQRSSRLRVLWHASHSRPMLVTSTICWSTLLLRNTSYLPLG